MLTERKKSLLNSIINQHIETAEPVGSNLLVGKYRLRLSPATVRNEMVALEKEGYIFQPHTSAGRVPTEKGYQFYIENFLKKKELSRPVRSRLEKAVKLSADSRIKIKELAKSLADLSPGTIIVAFGQSDVFYTGLANLFSQPEFSETETIYQLSAVIDHLDQAIYHIFNDIDEQIKILIGRRNPVGEGCSLVVTQYVPRQTRARGIFGILGPMRMDYNDNFALIEYAQQLIRQA